MKLLDVSVLVRLAEPSVTDAVRPLLERGQVATCGTVDLQLYAGMPGTLLARLAQARNASFAWLETIDADMRTAVATQRELIGQGLDGRCAPALVVAAIAARHAVPILHYDARFDDIAKITGQPAEWVVPAGSLNPEPEAGSDR